MRSDLFCCALAARLATSAASVTFSTNPRPKTGVGMRNMTLLRASSAAKFGCAILQPGVSDRPVITNRAGTPPSGDPSGLRTRRASRHGPPAVKNDGTAVLAPAEGADAAVRLGAR